MALLSRSNDDLRSIIGSVGSTRKSSFSSIEDALSDADANYGSRLGFVNETVNHDSISFTGNDKTREEEGEEEEKRG